jgi:hypothetical protein
MESPEGVAAKRKILVDALTMCLERSRVCEVVDPATIRSVLGSAAPEMWREGEFRLETLWKILCQQPGLSAKEVAPPLLVFKAYEDELGVKVRVPQALSALPRGEQVRLRDELGITKADFAKVIGELQALSTQQQESSALDRITEEASRGVDTPRAAPGVSGGPKKNRRPLALGLTAAAVVAVAISLFLTFRETAAPEDLSDLAGILKLTNGVREKTSLIASISDPRWNTLPKDQQQKLAERVFDLQNAKGVKSMTLLDGNGKQRVIAAELPDRKMVVVR